MKIQFVYFGKRGGGVNDLTSLLNSIENHDIKVYSLNNISIKNYTASISANIDFDYLAFPNSIFGFLIYIISFKWLRIFSILKKNNPEHIIITMFHPVNIFLFLYKFIFFKKIKIYYFLHNDNKIQTFNKFSDQIIRIFDVLYCVLSNKIFLLSENVYQYSKKHFILKYKKMSIIGFGVYSKRDAIVHAIDFYKSNPITFIYFGKILPYKGLDILLNALELLNKEGYNFKCYIIGEGELNYTKISDNVTIINEWVSDELLEDYINKSHFSIFPYRFCSQSGALSTAISNNIPVLVSDIPILTDYVNNFNMGLVISNLNAETIAKNIKEIDSNRVKLLSFHKNLLKYNQMNSSWQDVWFKIYRDLL